MGGEMNLEDEKEWRDVYSVWLKENSSSSRISPFDVFMGGIQIGFHLRHTKADAPQDLNECPLCGDNGAPVLLCNGDVECKECYSSAKEYIWQRTP